LDDDRYKKSTEKFKYLSIRLKTVKLLEENRILHWAQMFPKYGKNRQMAWSFHNAKEAIIRE
jgi:hypothetical protein